MTDYIQLGFEVSTGEPINIPLHHICVTGTTRLSGKTTTAEAIMGRLPEGFTSLAFRTKRGEVAFSKATPVQPYLAVRTDWEYVQSLLEAAMKERLKFERSWIINACRGTTSLRQVYDNIIAGRDSGKVRGLDQAVFTNLAAYFEKVLPQLEAHPFATTLEVSPGPNVMDLGHLSEEVQALVIASCLEEVWQHGCNCLIVIPEAWAFIPQSRGNPVKWAAQHVIRQGGAVGVYLLIDSQDLASVDKAVLKSCGVWLLGRQQEKNEVERVLAQLPVPRTSRPRADQIMTLPRGHFYVAAEEWCKQVYVRPAWLDIETAQAVAMRKIAIPTPQEDEEEDQMLQEENAELRRLLNQTQKDLALAQEGTERRLQELQERADVAVQSLKEAGAAHDLLLDRVKELQQQNTRDAKLWQHLQGFRLSVRGLLALEDGLPNGISAAFPDRAALVEETVQRVLRELDGRVSPGRPVLQLAPAPAIQEGLRRQMEEQLFKGLEDLPERQRHILAVLVGAGAPLTVLEIARRLGEDIKGSGGAQNSWGADTNALVKAGWAYRDTSKSGVKHRVSQKVVGTLEGVTSDEADLEAAVSTVMVMLAIPIFNRSKGA